MREPLFQKSAVELTQHIKERELSAQNVVEHFLQRIKHWDSTLKTLLFLNEKQALQQAEKIDQKIKKGEPVGKLAGIPILLKDNILTYDQPTTCASQMLKEYYPPYNATVVQHLIAEDAILLGKTNCDEFAMGSSTEYSSFFPTKNPWNTNYSPGGSSGGSAAAIAARFAPLALGSDTGGSIRQPASLCGIYGFKPTYGRVSRHGLIALASSLDQIGPMANRVEDLSLLLQIISGQDSFDATSLVPFSSQSNKASSITIGVPKEYFAAEREVQQIIEKTLALLKTKIPIQTKEIELSLTKYHLATYKVIATVEASSNLARYDGVLYGQRPPSPKNIDELWKKTRTKKFGPEVKRRILLGAYASTTQNREKYYKKAMKIRRLIQEEFASIFQSGIDVIANPTSPFAGFRLGEKIEDPLKMYHCDTLTVAANLTGAPAISIPVGYTSNGFPVGLQLQASQFQEEFLLQIAQKIQTVLAPFQKGPPSFGEISK